MRWFKRAIAVAVLGRNRALGVFFSALLFGALLTGTSTRNLDATVFRPDLAGWRRERAALRPTGRPIRIRPDWICEILRLPKPRTIW